MGSCRVREKLTPEADAHEGLAPIDGLAHEVVLTREPGMPVLLVDVHRAAENDERIEVLGRLGRRSMRDVPLEELVATLADDVGEEPGRAVTLVGQTEDAHAASVGKTVVPRHVLFASAVGRRGLCSTNSPRRSMLWPPLSPSLPSWPR